MNHNFPRAAVFAAAFFAFLVGQSSAAPRATNSASRTFNVRDFGATGDGTTLDTAAINSAIAACDQAGGGEVVFPAGRYLSGTIRLVNHLTLQLEAGATLVGTTNLNAYQHPTPPEFMPEAKWGKWHRALLVGENVADVTITGRGTIDGNKVFDPTGEERMRGPHAIVFVNCRKFVIRDISIVDAANYGVFFQVSDDVEVRNVKFVGGWDGVHWRGAPQRWCHNVNIIDCQFYTGDDSIAGRYWDNTVISGCIINSSCNGIRLIGPATRLIVSDCLFYGPGVRPHRSSNRTNMLAGIILQPGAWDKTEGLLDDVLVSGVTMRNVASPLTLWTKPGNLVGRVAVTGLNATGVYRAALSIESWSDLPITNVVVRNSQIEFTGGGTADRAMQPVKGPGVDPRPLPAWGVYVRNADRVTLEDVRLSVVSDDFRPVFRAESVGQFTLDNVRFPHFAAVTNALVTTNVANVTTHATEIHAR